MFRGRDVPKGGTHGEGSILYIFFVDGGGGGKTGIVTKSIWGRV